MKRSCYGLEREKFQLFNIYKEKTKDISYVLVNGGRQIVYVLTISENSAFVNDAEGTKT